MKSGSVSAVLATLVTVAIFPSCLNSGDVKTNVLENADYVALSDSRILIDDAISPAHLRSLLQLIHTRPQLITNVTITDEGPLLGHYTHEETRDIFRSASLQVANEKSGSGSGSDTSSSSSSSSSSSFKKRTSNANLKKLEAASHLVEVQTQIVDYAEAFFRKRFTIHSSLIFSRTRAELTEQWEQSPAGLNEGAGWLVPIHVDNCSFDQHLWSCVTLTDPRTVADHAVRSISVVLFLDDVTEGGEFVFVDHLSRPVAQVSMDDYAAMLNNGTIPRPFVPRSTHKEDSKKSKKGKSESTSRVLLPPSRDDIRRRIRRALSDKQQQEKAASGFSGSASVTNHSMAIDNKFVKHVIVAQNESSYTVVLPRSRRLAMFKSGRENVHAVMQIMSPHVHRFTLFMFLSEEEEREVKK